MVEASEAGNSEGRDRATEFVGLLNRYERRLAAYVAGLTPNWADADEIIQETRLRLWKQFDEYDPQKDFGAWACTIAYYLVLAHRNRLRDQRARYSDAFAERLAEEIASIPEEPGELQRALANCLEKLSQRNRELLRVFYAGEATVDELARKRGKTASAIYKALGSARDFLYECIERTIRQAERG